MGRTRPNRIGCMPSCAMRCATAMGFASPAPHAAELHILHPLHRAPQTKMPLAYSTSDRVNFHLTQRQQRQMRRRRP